MKKQRMIKKILGFGLGLSLLAGQTVYGADILVPPLPVGNESVQSQPVQGQTNQGPAQSQPVQGQSQPAGQNSTAAQPAGQDSAAAQTVQDQAAQNQAAQEQAAQGQASQNQTAAQADLKQPEVEAEGAVLIDGATGAVLYGKNQDQQFYPASITKIMTALLVLERCNLNDTVTFSSSATTNLEAGAVSLDITEGDQLTVEQCLYGLLLKSANEIGNGLAEHVAGSVSAFADLMNAKAKELGCKNTNFVNPHGLNNPNHKTTPYDMALIMRAALQNATFRKIDTTRSYEFPATKKAAARTISIGHKMMYPNDSRYYEGIVGGKTGFTSLAGNTLVTAVERNGVQLIAVVMKSRQTHYTDTKAMLDYGFANYAVLTGGSTAGTQDQGTQGQGNQSQGNQAQGEPAQSGTNSQPAGGPGAQSGQGQAGPGESQSGSQGPANANGTQGSSQGTQSSASQDDAGTWKEDSKGWYYEKENGKRATSEWQTIGGLDYWFGSDGYMATGWRKFTNGSWYYFKPSVGYKVTDQWVEDGGDWYYLGSDGVLLTNTTTPDGYPVDENGIWRQ